jgi:hypothetical protein
MNAEKKDGYVDHINHNKLDNRKENLRFCTFSQNAHNKKINKAENASSKYTGVSKQNGRWRCNIVFNKKREYYLFSYEDHAAYWYDQLSLKYYGIGNINNVDRPEGFVEPELFNRKESVRKCKKIPEIIERNSEGCAIIKINKIDQIIECIVDDDRYFDLIKYNWSMAHNYVSSKIDSRTIMIHRFLMDAKESDLIDHINRNPLDNRLINLRYSDKTLNNHNKTKKETLTSKYFGVHIRESGKFRAMLVKEGKFYDAGTHSTELEAANAYNIKAKEVYGDYANLNILPDVIEKTPKIFFKIPREQTKFNSYLEDSKGVLQRVYSCDRNWDLNKFESSIKYEAAKNGELWAFI